MPATARYANAWALPMNPVPMMPTPMSRTGLDLYELAGLRGFESGIREPQRLTAVARRHRHRRAGLQGIDEGLELEAVSRLVPFEKEVEERLPLFGVVLGVAPERSRPQVIIQ